MTVNPNMTLEEAIEIFEKIRDTTPWTNERFDATVIALSAMYEKHIIESQQQEIARLKAENAAMHRAYMKNQGVSIPDGYSGAITFCGIPISEAIDRVTAHPKLAASLAAETARADAAVRALTAYEDALFDERDVAYNNGYSDGYQDGTRGT